MTQSFDIRVLTGNKNIATMSIVCQLCHEVGTLLWLYTNTHKLTLCSYFIIYKQNRENEADIKLNFSLIWAVYQVKQAPLK